MHGGDPVGEWVDRYLEHSVAEHGFDLEFAPADADAAGTATLGGLQVGAVDDTVTVSVLEEDGWLYLAPAADVPDWVDDEDLPVSA